MSELISISRDGQELGAWSAVDVTRMLQTGVLTPADNFWQTGMTEWSTLDRFVLPATASKTYPIRFGSAFAVDQLGFSRTGQFSLTGTRVEISGPRLWSALIRVAIFLVATPILWCVLVPIAGSLRGESVLANLIGTCLSVFSVIGTPLVVLMLMQHFCVSPSNVSLQRSQISELHHKGSRISFFALLSSGKRRKALFRTATSRDAEEIAQFLQG